MYLSKPTHLKLNGLPHPNERHIMETKFTIRITDLKTVNLPDGQIQYQIEYVLRGELEDLSYETTLLVDLAELTSSQTASFDLFTKEELITLVEEYPGTNVLKTNIDIALMVQRDKRKPSDPLVPWGQI
jgi:hypothetical protein